MTRHSKNKRLLEKQIFMWLVFSISLITAIYFTYGNSSVANPSTVAFLFLIIVVLSSVFGNLLVAIIISIEAALSFNYFYLLPVGTFSIAAFSDWIALFAFLMTAILISSFSNSAYNRNAELRATQSKNVALKIFCEWLLFAPELDLPLSAITEKMIALFKFDYCSIYIMNEGKYHLLQGQSKSNELSAPEIEFLQKDHPAGFTNMVDECDLNVCYITVKNETNMNVIFAYKTNNPDIEFLSILSRIVSLEIKERI